MDVRLKADFGAPFKPYSALPALHQCMYAPNPGLSNSGSLYTKQSGTSMAAAIAGGVYGMTLSLSVELLAALLVEAQYGSSASSDPVLIEDKLILVLSTSALRSIVVDATLESLSAHTIELPSSFQPGKKQDTVSSIV